MRTTLLALVTFSLLLFSVDGLAQTQDTAAAKIHYEKAVGLFNSGAYAQALVEFRASYQAFPAWKLNYFIGLTLKELKKPLDAESEFNAYLLDGGVEVPADKKQEVEAILAELSALIGSIEIKANVEGASVYLNGDFIGKTPLPEAIRKEPGKVVVLVKKEGYDDFKTQEHLSGGGTVTVNATLAVVAAPAPIDEKIEPKAPITPAPKAEKPKQSSVMKKSGGALLGIGLASIVIGAATGGAAISTGKDLEGKCDNDVCDPKYRDDIDRMNALAWSSDVFLGIGLASAVVGAALLIVDKKRESKPQSPVALTSISPAGLTLKW